MERQPFLFAGIAVLDCMARNAEPSAASNAIAFASRSLQLLRTIDNLKGRIFLIATKSRSF